jgi:hypothetical protein
MKHSQRHLVYSIELKPGKYFIYAHLDPSRVNGYYPDSAVLSVYSSMTVQLDIAPAFNYANILKEAFVNDGLKYGYKTVENNGLMSISTRTLFDEGGFAYIYFYNDKRSDKNFMIEYDEKYGILY